MNSRVLRVIMIGFFSMTLRSGLPAQNQKVLLHERASWLAFQELCWVTQLNDGRLARIDPAKDGAESVGILKFSNLLDLGGQGDHSGAIEPTFEELSDGRLFMLIRTNYDQFWTAYSADKGQSWREIRYTERGHQRQGDGQLRGHVLERDRGQLRSGIPAQTQERPPAAHLELAQRGRRQGRQKKRSESQHGGSPGQLV